MSYKRIIGIVACLGGITLIIFAVHSMRVISNAKNEVANISNQMSGNYVGRRISNNMEYGASEYDTQVNICLYSGIALALIGSGLIFFCRKRK